ncbi:hypothetical protein QBC46DRAFT_438695 [Diplogelasinospora grovesii]|uniref:Uncharacterized protein n=1 Tax=Diplogelasinospora grovesii TaxID=303347 RepID=A0AAN6N5Z7_9PEZI|nr:hypothetical protein QBC46DRAFT_438695 [Diplogelasinospora grovesii]
MVVGVVAVIILVAKMMVGLVWMIPETERRRRRRRREPGRDRLKVLNEGLPALQLLEVVLILLLTLNEIRLLFFKGDISLLIINVKLSEGSQVLHMIVAGRLEGGLAGLDYPLPLVDIKFLLGQIVAVEELFLPGGGSLLAGFNSFVLSI